MNKNKFDYLVLINKENKLPNNWEEKIELINTKNTWDEDIKIERKTFEQYKKLKKCIDKDLKEFNVTIELDSTYRSIKDQQELWDRWLKDPEKGSKYVKKSVALSGYSEHHTGLAIDICLKINGKLVDDNEEMLKEKEIFSKIHSKLASYGFVLRYLEGKEKITGYPYEPWHLRYINDTKVAKEIMDKQITLEEFLKK